MSCSQSRRVGDCNMYTKDQMMEEFTVLAFCAGMCVVTRRSDGMTGTLDFNHGSPSEPRMYTNFQPSS